MCASARQNSLCKVKKIAHSKDNFFFSLTLFLSYSLVRFSVDFPRKEESSLGCKLNAHSYEKHANPMLFIRSLNGKYKKNAGWSGSNRQKDCHNVQMAESINQLFLHVLRCQQNRNQLKKSIP